MVATSQDEVLTNGSGGGIKMIVQVIYCEDRHGSAPFDDCNAAGSARDINVSTGGNGGSINLTQTIPSFSVDEGFACLRLDAGKNVIIASDKIEEVVVEQRRGNVGSALVMPPYNRV